MVVRMRWWCYGGCGGGFGGGDGEWRVEESGMGDRIDRVGLEYGRYGLEYGVLPSSGYGVLDLVSFVVFAKSMAEEQDEQQQQQQTMLDAELVPINDHVKIGMSNFRIALEKTQPDPIYKVCLEIPKQFSVYNAFIATADALEIYMQ
ncbi:hypothetical protein Tco_0588013 [Tanacetum coccineum]